MSIIDFLSGNPNHKRNKAIIMTRIKSALGKSIENCEDLEDLVQDVYTMLLEAHKNDSVTINQIILDINDFSRRVAYAYLRGKMNTKIIKKHVSQETTFEYQLETLS